MKFMRFTLAALLTLLLTAAITALLGQLRFTPRATQALVRFAAFLGAYGDEQVQDVYLCTSLLLGLALAITLVWAGFRLRARRITRRP